MGNTLFLMRGDKWRKMRTTLTPAFTSAKMRHMFDLVRDCAITSTDFLLETFFGAVGCEMEMEMQDFYSRVTNDTIASCAFGLKINSLFDRENVFYETGCKIQHLSSVKAFLKISGLRAFPWLFKKLNIEFVDADMRKVFSDLVLQNIDERRKNQIVRADLIDLLLHASSGSAWSNDEIISQAFVFFLAGFDTSMWVILALTYELALNPNIQGRLIGEIDALNSEVNDREITYDALNKLKYLDMVVMETLRMHSPAVLIDRLCSKRFHLTDGDAINVQIEKNDHIWVPIYCFHHNRYTNFGLYSILTTKYTGIFLCRMLYFIIIISATAANFFQIRSISTPNALVSKIGRISIQLITFRLELVRANALAHDLQLWK